MPYPFFKKKSSGIARLSYLLFLFISINSIAQVKWDGEGGDGQWNTAYNWVGNIVPSATNDVVLDNSFVAGSYIVSLPASAVAIIIKSITITPAALTSIQFIIPSANNAAPAFTATGPGYGIIINNGGMFLNSSGLSSTASISVNDSMQINNGGQYTHNSRSSHAVLVSSLSKAAGTEKGIFKFDIPGGGYTVATTGRTYGTLLLSADASAGTQVYSSSAASPLIVNGDLIINAGVTLNLDLTASTTIKGSYVQNGGVFNLASQPNSNVIYVKGDFIQAAGNITETSSGLPAIELNGNSIQRVAINGTITNNVDVRINNNTGISLLSSLLLPYHLNLISGIVNTNTFIVTLQTGCTIQADSLSNNSFINGPLRKEGLSATNHFLFPVGKDIAQRWLELKNVSGNYTVEFIKANPNGFGSVLGNGIHHISSIEYWSVKPDASPAPIADVELSFNNVNSGGVTDIATLRVAQLLAGVWKNMGNSSVSGTAGSSGSVVSNPINAFDPAVNYFTLASSNEFQNPLPLMLLSFDGEYWGSNCMINWNVSASLQTVYFELESSENGIQFDFVSKLNAIPGQTVYHYMDQRKLFSKRFYRLKIIETPGSFFYSAIIQLAENENANPAIEIWPAIVKSNANLIITAAADGNARINIINIDGRLLYTLNYFVHSGSNSIPLQLHSMTAGIYVVVTQQQNRISKVQFMKAD